MSSREASTLLLALMTIKNLLWLLAFSIVPTLTRSQAVPVVLPVLNGADEGSVRYVGGLAVRNGEDIGAQINQAYASLPPSGGTIVVIADSSRRCYDFKVPIVAAVPAKYLLLESGSLPSQITTAASSACLNFVPTSAR